MAPIDELAYCPMCSASWEEEHAADCPVAPMELPTEPSGEAPDFPEDDRDDSFFNDPFFEDDFDTDEDPGDENNHEWPI